MQRDFQYCGPQYSDGPFCHCRVLTNTDGDLDTYTILSRNGQALVEPARSAVNVVTGDNLMPSWRAYRGNAPYLPR